MSRLATIIDLTESITQYRIQFNEIITRFLNKGIKIRYNLDYLFIDLLHICIQSSANNLLWMDDESGREYLLSAIQSNVIPPVKLMNKSDLSPFHYQDVNFHNYSSYLEEAELFGEEEGPVTMVDHFCMEISSVMVAWTDDIVKQVLRHVIATELGKLYFDLNTQSTLITSIESASIFPFRDSNDVFVVIHFNGD